MQGVMIAPQGAGQVPLCAASKQQEVVHALVLRSQLFVSELHRDNTPPLHRQRERKKEVEGS